MHAPISCALVRPAEGPPSCSGRLGSAGFGRARRPSVLPAPSSPVAGGGRRSRPPTAAGRDPDYDDGVYDAIEAAPWRPARPGEGGFGDGGGPSSPPPPGGDFWTSASADDDGVLGEATAALAAAAAIGGAGPSPLTPPRRASPLTSPLVPDDALLSEAPGTQAARLRDLQAAAAARRDVHWAMYRAHSAKANLLATAVLLCTTAGGTSGLVSLIGGGGPGGSLGGPTAPAWGGQPQQWSPAPQQGLYGSGYGGFSAPPPGPASQQAAPPAGPPPPQPQATTAALLAPVLGYAATLMSGWQSYSKPSTAASRHLTAFKRYQLLARHARDALAYGRAASLGRVIQAVERKIDQYCDESPVIGLGEPMEAGSGGASSYPPPPSPGKAFWQALMELPE